MRYLGGKSRLARKIVDVIKQRAPETRGIIEPFCGGAAVTEYLCAWRPTLAADAFPGLAGMLDAVRQGLRLPIEGVTDAQYAALRDAARAGNHDPFTVAVGFGLSFGGRWFGGNARCIPGDPKEDYGRFFNAWADRLTTCSDLTLAEADYQEFADLAEPGTTIYCDPPYRATTGYATGYFDSDKFDQMCWFWRSKGARVFVSEFWTPWAVVGEFPRQINLDRNRGSVCKPCIDRLYEVDP